MKRIFDYSFFLLVIVILLASCTTTKVTAVWKDESYQGVPRRVLIYAILRKPINRRIFEDEFANHFKALGIDAVPGYVMFPGKELVTEDVIAAKLKNGAFDSLLLVQPMSKRTEQVQIPGTITYMPISPPVDLRRAPKDRKWPQYYAMGYTIVYTPSYTVENRYVMTETGLYDVATENLIWSAASETKIDGTTEKLIKTYVSVIMDAMRKQNVIAAQ
jgi:hypothetical protein